MLDIADELRKLVAVLDEHEIDYALWGGMAMGVYGLVVDIKALAGGFDEAG
ncbi:MAG: hypothetical protein AABN95_21685 [Acidobacteriota bacterium]